MNDHECFVAQTAKEMLERNDWIVPHFSNMPRLQKPPLAYWCVAGLATVRGAVSDAVARLPSAFAELALVVLMAGFGRRVFGSAAAGWFAAAVTACCGALLYFSHQAIVDMQLTFWCTLAGALLWLAVNTEARARRVAVFAAAGGAMGVAMLAKAPMPLAVLLPGFAIYLLVTGRIRKIGMYLLESLPGLALSLLLWLPWVLMVLHRVDSDAVGAKWYREFLLRYEGDIGSGDRVSPWWFYAVRLLGMLLPWTASLPEALASPWLKRYRPWRDVMIFAFCIAIFNLVFFSTADYKREHYLLPAVPWFCLLLVLPVWRFFADPQFGQPRHFRLLGWSCIVLLVLGSGSYLAHALVSRPSYAGPLAGPVAAAAVGLLLVGFAFCRVDRLKACYLLLLTIAVTFCLSWVMLPSVLEGTDNERAFTERVRRIASADAGIYWLGRPDTRLVYYGGLRFPRVLTDLQTEERIRDKHLPRNSQSGRLVTVRALLDLLASDKPVYVLAVYANWQELCQVSQFLQLNPKLLYRQTASTRESRKNPVLIGNLAAAGIRPDDLARQRAEPGSTGRPFRQGGLPTGIGTGTGGN